METHKKGLWKLWKLFSYFQNFGNFGNFPRLWKLWKLLSELSEKICTIAMIIIMSSVALNIIAIDLQLIAPFYHLAQHIILEWVASTIECQRSMCIDTQYLTWISWLAHLFTVAIKTLPTYIFLTFTKSALLPLSIGGQAPCHSLSAALCSLQSYAHQLLYL